MKQTFIAEASEPLGRGAGDGKKRASRRMSCVGPPRRWPLISYFNKVAPRCPWCLPVARGCGKSQTGGGHNIIPKAHPSPRNVVFYTSTSAPACDADVRLLSWWYRFEAFLSRWNNAPVGKRSGCCLTGIFSSRSTLVQSKSSNVSSVFLNQTSKLLRGEQRFCRVTFGFNDLLSCAVGYRKLEQCWLAFELRSRQFSVEKQKHIISTGKAADLEMYSMQYVIATLSAQTAAICHKLRLLLATQRSNMWPNLDEQPLSKYWVESCHF